MQKSRMNPSRMERASGDRLPDATGREAAELGRQGCPVLSEIRLLAGRASSSRRQA